MSTRSTNIQFSEVQLSREVLEKRLNYLEGSIKLCEREVYAIISGNIKLCEWEVYAIKSGSAKHSVSEVHLSREVLEK
jgi:hypothetical protein